MANPCDLAEDDLLLDDAHQSDVIASHDDAASAGDGHIHEVVSLTVESATLDDAAIERATLEVDETAVLDDAVSIGLSATTDVIEVATLNDASATFLSQDTEEAVELADAVTHRVESNTVEAAELVEATEIAGTFTTDVDEAAVLDDAVRDGAVQLVADAAELADATTDAVQRSDAAVELAVLDDEVQIGATVVTLAADGAVLDDAHTDRLDATDAVTEVAYLDDATVGGGNASWRAHVETWAVSRYTNTPWNSMAVIDGALFAAGPEGIYELAGNTDAGVEITATLQHDWLNWAPDRRGNPAPDHHLKRPRYLYLEEVKADGELAVTLGYVTIDGAKSVSEYPLPDVAATGFINVRVPLGRGIRSQFLQPTIRNVAGSDFEFGGGRLVVDSLARNL